MYPEAPETSRESLLAVCLKGDELADHRQKILRKELGGLCNALFEMWVYDNCDKRYANKALEAEENILKIIRLKMFIVCSDLMVLRVSLSEWEWQETDGITHLLIS